MVERASKTTGSCGKSHETAAPSDARSIFDPGRARQEAAATVFARAAIFRAFALVSIFALRHKFGDDSMEVNAVVVTELRQIDEVTRGDGHLICEELYLEAAHCSLT